MIIDNNKTVSKYINKLSKTRAVLKVSILSQIILESPSLLSGQFILCATLSLFSFSLHIIFFNGYFVVLFWKLRKFILETLHTYVGKVVYLFLEILHCGKTLTFGKFHFLFWCIQVLRTLALFFEIFDNVCWKL